MAPKTVQSKDRSASGKGFKKGQSGNPGGRPKGLVAYVKEKYGQDGRKLVDELGKIAFDTEQAGRVRVMAISTLLDRGWGKPIQTVDVNTPVPLFALPADAIPDMSGAK